MERELWSVLYQLAKAWDRPSWWTAEVYQDYEIVAVYCWAVLHERPTSWACDPRNWPEGLWPAGRLPSQSTMSQRLRKLAEARHRRRERNLRLRQPTLPLTSEETVA